MLQDGLGYRFAYALQQGGFSTVTRAVAATQDGLPKVIISYATNALPQAKGEVPEPWKDDDVKVLMRLRASVTPDQLKLFGWNSTKDPLPAPHDPEQFFPQYVPMRQKCATPAFTVTWVRKAIGSMLCV